MDEEWQDLQEHIKEVEEEVNKIKDIPSQERLYLVLHRILVTLRKEEERLASEKQKRADAHGVTAPTPAQVAQAEVDEYAKMFLELPNPYNLHPAELQMQEKPLIKNWRPPKAAAILPPQLIHPVFGNIMDIMDSMAPPMKEDQDFALDMCTATWQYFPYQDDLEAAVTDVLNRHLKPWEVIQLCPFEGNHMQTWAIVDKTVDPDTATWMPLLCAFELDIGMGDGEAEPSYQAAGFHGSFYASRATSHIVAQTACPTLLLEVLGPHVRISALSWLDRFSVVPLTPLMHTLLLLHDDGHMSMLARMLGALRHAVNDLGGWYKQQSDGAKQGSSGSGRSASVLEGLPYPLHSGYCNIKRLIPTGYTYSAQRLDSGRCVVVKFSQHYGQDAHEAWAREGFAPELYSCTPMPGGWVRLEMELLGDGWLGLWQLKGTEAAAACKAALKALRAAHRLPGRKWAHGDLRPANVMVRRAGQDSMPSWEVRFIDFERSGEEGVKTYPIFMSTSIQWPEGVECGQPLKQAHDVELFAAGCQEHLLAAGKEGTTQPGNQGEGQGQGTARGGLRQASGCSSQDSGEGQGTTQPGTQAASQGESHAGVQRQGKISSSVAEAIPQALGCTLLPAQPTCRLLVPARCRRVVGMPLPVRVPRAVIYRAGAPAVKLLR